jgi:hypothetical protein
MLRVDIESTSSSPFHAFHDVRRFFNNIWPSFDRKGRHRSKPEAPEVIDFPLCTLLLPQLVPEKAEATYDLMGDE